MHQAVHTFHRSKTHVLKSKKDVVFILGAFTGSIVEHSNFEARESSDFEAHLDGRRNNRRDGRRKDRLDCLWDDCLDGRRTDRLV